MLYTHPSYIGTPHAGRLRESAQCERPADSELERIVRAAGDGDAPAWSALVVRFRGGVIRVARSYGLNAHEADDVAQETWLRLFRHIRSVRDPLALDAWLRTTARRESLRAIRRRREVPTDAEIGVDAVAPDDHDADVLRERRDAVTRELDALPARHRALMESLMADPAPSYAELSVQLDMPIGSIGPIRGRCVARLRRALVAEAL
jgi:RNA polymerase sigma factor (sigma-70 family)